MNEDRAREGVEHLQAAALEVIRAVRAFLDVAEDLIAEHRPESTGRSSSSTDAHRASRVTRISVS